MKGWFVMGDNNSKHDCDKRVIRTKKAIKSALFKLMEQKDVDNISISELTKEANVNRRTFYTHYHGITDILDEVESDLVAALARLVKSIDPSAFRKSAYELFIGLDELITVEFDYYFHIVRVDTRGMLMSRLKSVIKGMTDMLLDRLSKRHGEGVAVISSFIVGGFFNMYLEWHYHPNGCPIERAAELAGEMVELCVENVSPAITEQFDRPPLTEISELD